jgi:hypothetical protein
MEMRVEGLDQLLITLQHGGEKVKDNARKVMKREADKIQERAVLYAPVDDGQLERSIHLEKGYEDNGRLMIAVVAGGIVDGINVDAYAALIHENYESMKPGPNTIAKRDANPGVYVGGKFLDRAAKDSAETLEKAIIKVVTDDLREMLE